jgi:hypothetical protein
MKRNPRGIMGSKKLLQEKREHLLVDHQEMSQKVILDSPVAHKRKNLQCSLVLFLIPKKKMRRKKKRKDQSQKLKVQDFHLGIPMQVEVVVANDLILYFGFLKF